MIIRILKLRDMGKFICTGCNDFTAVCTIGSKPPNSGYNPAFAFCENCLDEMIARLTRLRNALIGTDEPD